jgi:hypothetical protein
MDEEFKFDAKRFRRRHGRGMTLRIRLAKAVLGIGALYRFRFSFMNVPFALLCLGCAFFGAACAHNDDSSADHSQHRQHHGGSYGHGQSGGFDRSDASQSSTPIPGE